MKKFGLILICSVIMTVFIAFNYLLWDRERNFKNIENLNDSKNASLDSLSREYDVTRQLRNKVNELDDYSKQLQTKISQFEQERQKLKAGLEQDNQNLYALKLQTDMSVLETVVRLWAEDVDKGRYENAYRILGKPSGYENLNEFTNTYKNAVKSMKIKSIKLLSEDLPNDRKGDLLYQVALDIKKQDNASLVPFNEGLNTRFFLMGYDKDKKAWTILSISSSP